MGCFFINLKNIFEKRLKKEMGKRAISENLAPTGVGRKKIVAVGAYLCRSFFVK